MINKQILGFAVVSLLSIFQSSFSMESDSSGKKSKTRDFKTDAQEPQAKRHKNAESEEKEKEEEIVDEREQNSFDGLPMELKVYILQQGLKSIIHSNAIFRPLNGAKSYLNLLVLVNKEFKIIAEALGWNNKLWGENLFGVRNSFIRRSVYIF